jgi:hypothetical protein
MKPPLHNPDNLTPEQYGASEGWRLLYPNESPLPADAEKFSSKRWEESSFRSKPAPMDFITYTYRTRTPDPYATQATTDKPADGWIRMSERKPTEADLPVWVYQPNAADGVTVWLRTMNIEDMVACEHAFPMWQPARIPAPPPREMTQRELDRRAYEDWSLNGKGDAWSAAIACERAEIAKIIEQHFDNGRTDSECLRFIRARVEGGKP